MGFLDRVTKIGKIGLLLFIIGTVIFIVGFAVPYWVVEGETGTRIGLWEYCGARSDYCGNILNTDAFNAPGKGLPAWFRGTQALACLALIAIIVALVLKFLFLCGKPKKFLLISIIMDIVAAVLAFLAAVVFGSEFDRSYHYNLHFGFAFDIIGGIFLVGSAVCFIVEYIRR